MRCLIRLSVSVALLLFASCAGLVTRPEPPSLVLTDLRVAGATLFSQQYLLDLQVQNPNESALAIEGLACELLLNGQRFATGVSNRAVTVPGYGTGSVQVEATSTLAGIFRQLTELERSQAQSFRYELRGHVNLRGFGRLPFDQSGELSLVPRELQKSP
ncbi:MAG: LEA type 2 family protein [Proteobacteria bacterium]|nr:LEA type 2 family protein [Pseudomonadota bacterium]